MLITKVMRKRIMMMIIRNKMVIIKEGKFKFWGGGQYLKKSEQKHDGLSTVSDLL